jgi:hypothetical protein
MMARDIGGTIIGKAIIFAGRVIGPNAIIGTIDMTTAGRGIITATTTTGNIIAVGIIIIRKMIM